MASERTKIIEKFKKKYEKDRNKEKWSDNVNKAYDKVLAVDQILNTYATATSIDRKTVTKFRDVVIPTRLALEKCWALADKYNESLDEYGKKRDNIISRLDNSAKIAMEALDKYEVYLTPREQRALFYILDDVPLEKLILPDRDKFPSADGLGKQFPSHGDWANRNLLSKSMLVRRLISEFEAAIKEWKKKK